MGIIERIGEARLNYREVHYESDGPDTVYIGTEDRVELMTWFNAQERYPASTMSFADNRPVVLGMKLFVVDAERHLFVTDRGIDK